MIFENIFVGKEQPEFRFVRVTRDTQGYDFKPAKLALRSACEFAMDYETVSNLLKVQRISQEMNRAKSFAYRNLYLNIYTTT